MGAFRQFFLMLWKSYVQRKRQWWLFLLEFLLPILLLVVVVLVRYGTKPDDQQDCYYQPRASPESGYAFVQDTACGLDNKCFPSEEEAMAYRQAAPISSLYQAVLPLYNSETMAALASLQETTEFIADLAEVLGSEEVQNLIEFDGRVGGLFRDESVVRQYLIQNDYLSEDVVDTVLNSTLNITKLYELANVPSLRELACDPSQLSQMLIFPSGGATAEDVSSEVCDLNEELVPEIINRLLAELNVTALIKVLRDLSAAQGEYTQANLLEDLIAMANLIGTLDTPRALLGDLQVLNNLGDWVRDIAAFLGNLGLSNGGVNDLSVFGGILEQLGPVFDTLFPDNALIGDLNTAFRGLDAIFGWFNGNVANGYNTTRIRFMDLLPSDADPAQLFAVFNLTSDELQMMLNASVNLEALTSYFLSSSPEIKYYLCTIDLPAFNSLFIQDTPELAILIGRVDNTLCSLDANHEIFDTLGNLLNVQNLIQELQEITARPMPVDWTSFLEETSHLFMNSANLIQRIDPLILLAQSGAGVEAIYRGVMALLEQFTKTDPMQDIMSTIESALPALEAAVDFVVDGDALSQLELAAHFYMLTLDVIEQISEQNQNVSEDLATLLLVVSEKMRSDMDLQGLQQVLSSLLTTDKMEELLASDSAIEVLCNPVSLQQLLPEVDANYIYDVTIALCSQDVVVAIESLVASITDMGPAQAIEGLLEMDTTDVPAYTLQEIVDRSIRVFEGIVISTQAPNEVWITAIQNLPLSEQELAESLEWLATLAEQINTQNIDNSLDLGDLLPVLEEISRQPEIGRPLAGAVAVIHWLDQHGNFLFDATQWSFGSLVDGDSFGEELNNVLDLSAELIQLFLNQQIDFSHFQEYMQAVASSGNNLCVEPGIASIFGDVPAHTQEQLDTLEEGLCGDALENDQAARMLEDLLNKMEGAMTEYQNIDWSAAIEAVISIIEQLARADTSKLMQAIGDLTTNVSFDRFLEVLMGALNQQSNGFDMNSLAPVVNVVQMSLNALDPQTRAQVDAIAQYYMLILDVTEAIADQNREQNEAAVHLVQVLVSKVMNETEWETISAVLSSFLVAENLQELQAAEDPLGVLCDPTALANMLPEHDFSEVVAFSAAVCDEQVLRAIERLAMAGSGQAVGVEFAELTRALEEGLSYVEPLNITALIERTFAVYNEFVSSSSTAGWEQIINNPNYGTGLDWASFLINLAKLLAMDSAQAGLQNLYTTLDQLFPPETGAQTPFVMVAALLHWMDENGAFIFDARQWTFGSLVEGERLAEELNTILQLNVDALEIMLNTPINMEKLQDYVDAIQNSNGSLCFEPSIEEIFMYTTEYEKETLRMIQDALCAQPGPDDQATMIYMELVFKLIEAQYQARVDWEAMVSSIINLVDTLSKADINHMLQVLGEISTEVDLESYLGQMAALLTYSSTSLESLFNVVLPVIGLTTATDPTMQMVNQYLHTATTMIEVAERGVYGMSNMGDAMAAAMRAHPEFRTMTSQFVRDYPDEGFFILAKLMDPVIIQEILEADDSRIDILCNETALSKLLSLDEYVSESALDLLCQYEITPGLQAAVTEYGFSELETKLDEALDILSGKTVVTTSLDYGYLYSGPMVVYYTAMNLQETITEDPVWQDVRGMLEVNPGEVTDEAWTQFKDYMTLVYINSTTKSLVVELGKRVEENESWMSIAPLVKAAVTLTRMVMNETQHLDSMLNGATGYIAARLLPNIPSLIHTFTPLLQNQEKLTEFFNENNGDIRTTLCTNAAHYVTPDAIFTETKMLLCDEGMIDKFEEEWMDIYVTLLYPIEVTLGYLGATNPDTFDKNIPWEQLYTDVMKTVQIANDWYSSPTPWRVFATLDLQATLEALISAINAALTMPDMSSPDAQAEMIRNVLLTSLGDDGADLWGAVTYYAYVYDRFLDLALESMDQEGADWLSLDTLLGDSELFGNLTVGDIDVEDALSDIQLNYTQLLNLLLSGGISEPLDFCYGVHTEHLFIGSDYDPCDLLLNINGDMLLEEILNSPYMSDLNEIIALLNAGFDPSETQDRIDYGALIQKTEQVFAAFTNTENLAESIPPLLNELLMALERNIMSQGNEIETIEELVRQLLESGELVKALISMVTTPQFNQQVHGTQALLEVLMAELERFQPENATVESVLKEAPEMYKLVTLVADVPEIPVILAVSYNSSKFQALLAMDASEAVNTFCNGQVTDYLSYPNQTRNAGHGNRKLMDIQTRFCDVDFEALANNAYYREKIVYVIAQYGNTEDITLSDLIRIPEQTGQASYMFDTFLMRFGEFAANERLPELDIVRLQQFIGGLLTALDTYPDVPSDERFEEAVELVLSRLSYESVLYEELVANLTSSSRLLIDAIDEQMDLALTPNLSLYDLLTPNLLAVLESKADLVTTDVMELLKVPFKENATSLSQITSQEICAYSVEVSREWVSLIFNTNNVDEYTTILCSLNKEEWTEIHELLREQTGLAQFFTALAYYLAQPAEDRDFVTENLPEEIREFYIYPLDWMNKNSDPDLETNLNLEQLDTFVYRVLMNVTSDNVDKVLEALDIVVLPLRNTNVWQIIEPYMTVGYDLAEHITNMTNFTNHIRLASIVGGESHWNDFLIDTLGLNQSLAAQLHNANISVDMLSQFASWYSEGKLEGELRAYFQADMHFHSWFMIAKNVDERALYWELYSINWTVVVEAFKGLIDPVQLAYIVQNPEIPSYEQRDKMLESFADHARGWSGTGSEMKQLFLQAIEEYSTDRESKDLTDLFSGMAGYLRVYDENSFDAPVMTRVDTVIMRMTLALATKLNMIGSEVSSISLGELIHEVSGFMSDLRIDENMADWLLNSTIEPSHTENSTMMVVVQQLPDILCDISANTQQFSNIYPQPEKFTEEEIRDIAQQFCDIDLHNLTSAVQKYANMSYFLEHTQKEIFAELPFDEWNDWTTKENDLRDVFEKILDIDTPSNFTYHTFLQLLYTVYNQAASDALYDGIIDILPQLEGELNRDWIEMLTSLLFHGDDPDYVSPIYDVLEEQQFVQVVELVFAELNKTLLSMPDNELAGLFAHIDQWLSNMADAGIEPSLNAQWQQLMEVFAQIMASVDVNQNDYLTQVCEESLALINTQIYEGRMIPYLAQWQGYLTAGNALVGTLQPLYEASCTINSSSLLDFYHAINRTGFVQAFSNLFNVMNHPVQPFECGVYIDTVGVAVDLFSEESTNHAGQALQCLIDSSAQNLPALAQIENILVLLGDLGMLAEELPSLGLDQLQGLIPYINMTLNAAFQSNPIYSSLTSLITDPAALRQLISDTTGLDGDVIDAILSASVDITTDIMGMSDEELAAVLCDPDWLSRTLTLPDELDLSSVIGQACADSRAVEQLASQVRALVDTSALLLQLSQATPNFSLNMTWIEDFISDIGVLLQQLEALTSLLSSSALDNIAGDIDGSLDGTIELLTTGGIDAIADSVNAILEDFKGLVDDPFSLMILGDLQKVVDGLRGLYFFQRGLTVTVRDILNDPDDFERYLTDDLDLSDEVAMAIIEARLPILQLSSLAETFDLNTLICDPTELATLITLPENSNTDVATISSEMCGLSPDELAEIFEFLVDELDVGELLSQFIELDAGSILENAGLDIDQLQRSLDILSPLQNTIDTVGSSFAALSDNDINLEEVIGTLTASESLADQETLESLSQLVCGRKDAFNLRDSFGLTGDDTTETLNSGDDRRRRKKRDAYEGASEWQRYELGHLNTVFCKDLYWELQQTQTGKVVWRFIKPFLQGRVFYAPDNVLTRAIMQETLSVFDDLEELRQVLDAFRESTSSLTDVAYTPEDLATIQSALENPIISSFVGEIISVNPSDLIASLEMLQNVDTGTLDSVNVALDILSKASQCISSGQRRLEPYPNFASMEREVNERDKRFDLLAVILFEDMKDYPAAQSGGISLCDVMNDTDIVPPKHIKYRIRMNNDNVPTTAKIKHMYWRPGPDDNLAEDQRYFRGFVQVQAMLDTAIIKLHTHCDLQVPYTETQQMPYPCWAEDRFETYVTMYVFPIMMVFVWLIAIASATSKRVADKQLALEETMKSMGLRSRVSWFSWFISCFFVMCVLSCIIVLFLKFGDIYPHSNAGVLIIFLFVFSFSTLMVSYLVSVFFTNAVLATLVAMIVYTALYMPFFIIIAVQEDLSLAVEIVVNLACNTAFSNAAQAVAVFELRGEGVQWDNMDHRVLSSQLTFDYLLLMMVLDGILYAIIGWYCSNVFPGKYGVAQPWYFPVLPRYWGCTCCLGDRKSAYRLEKRSKEGGANSYEDDRNIQGQSFKPVSEITFSSITSPPPPPFEPSAFEEMVFEGVSKADKGPGERDPHDLNVGIALHRLEKRFGKNKVLNNLDANIYQNQVTALLGKNGSGKTTAINLITGMRMPTHGIVYVNGKDVVKHTASVRKDLGICPQQNILFDYMTVWEHLDFYSSLRGKYSGKDRKQDIKKLIVKLGLISHTFVRADQLSGGQKRKLQVGIAFVGGPKVIILDEPTSGIDSQARRHIWDLINDNKAGRTILLCTHHLDEADILADRVLLLHKGQVLSKGSPLYMKREFGYGYRLHMEKEVLSSEGANGGTSEPYNHSHCKSSDVLALIRSHVSEAEILEERGSDMTFILPTNRGQRAHFPAMFNDLEAQKSALSVANYGVSDSTLDEVFMKVTQAADSNKPIDAEMLRKMTTTPEVANGQHGRNDSVDSISIDPDAPVPETSYSSNDSDWNSFMYICFRCFPRLMALFYKQAYHTLRNWRSYLSFALLPVILVIIAMLCMKYKPENEDEPRLQLTPEIYENSHSFYKLDGSSPMLAVLEREIHRQEGMATACFSGSQYKCNHDGHSLRNASNVDDSAYEKRDECRCTDDGYSCPRGSYGVPPPELRYESGAFMYDLTHNVYDINEHIMQSHIAYLDERYGGVSMGHGEDGTGMRVWYNNKGFHSVTAFQSAASNLLLRAVKDLSDSEAQEYGITAINHPLPGDYNDFSEETLLQKLSDVGVAMILLIAFSFVVAGHSVYLVNERVKQEKRLQLIYGVPVLMYWLVAYIYQLALSAIPVLMTLGVMRAFNLPEYTAGEHSINLWAHGALLFLFCWAAIPGMYLLVRFCRYVHNAYIMIFLLSFFIGLITTMCMFLLNYTSYEEEIKKAADVLKYVFLILAPYCLGDGSMVVTHNEFTHRLTEKYLRSGEERISPFDREDGIGWHLIALAIQGAVFFLLHLFIEVITCARSHQNTRHRDLDYLEDSDVSLERQRVDAGGARDDTLIIQNLRKSFRRGASRVQAVNNLSVGVPRGECFGLLGVNGAGKTTVFHTITGEHNPSKGVVLFKGRVVNGSPSALRGKVGYCPQSNALDDYLTGRALLKFYCHIKGVKNVDWTSSRLLHEFGLMEWADTLTSKYSGGTKRKLQAAIALIGSPDLVLLDEPTAGIDVTARKEVWRNLKRALQDDCTIVLTSHSVSECEELCSRFGFMVNGKFTCLGSAQHLKNKFGHGYMVTIRVGGDEPDFERVVTFMETSFPQCYLKDSHLNQLEFCIEDARSLNLADVFGRLEASKHALNIQEYSLSQTSLERVFMNFSERQGDGTGLSDVTSTDGSHTTPRNGYTNRTYGSLEKPTTPTHINGGRTATSLSSIPGYRRSEIAAAEGNDVNVSLADEGTLNKRNLYSSGGFTAANNDEVFTEEQQNNAGFVGDDAVEDEDSVRYTSEPVRKPEPEAYANEQDGGEGSDSQSGHDNVAYEDSITAF